MSADYEQDQFLDFTLDIGPGGLYKDQAFNLDVIDDNNQAPTSISLDKLNVTGMTLGVISLTLELKILKEIV